jgi:hypothetical protein
MKTLIPHYEYIEGGGITTPYMEEQEFEVGISSKDRKGEKWKGWSKIPFKTYEHHKLNKNKTLPMNKDLLCKEDVIIDFLRLKVLNAVFIPVNTYEQRYIGNHITDYFNEELRTATKSATGKSLNELWNNLETRKKIYENAYQIKKQNLFLRGDYNHKTAPQDIFSKLTDTDLKGTFANSVMSNNQFKPFVAKVVYTYFNNIDKIDTILDFSAGWGGRMVGALCLNKNYIGIDPNVSLRKSYIGILETLKDYNSSNVKIKFNYGENVDFSKLKYDFVLTSPPYLEEKGGLIEIYENIKEYDDDSFYHTFIFPTVYRILHYLPMNKYFCLNTNVSNMNVIKEYLLGEETMKIPYKTKERAGGPKRRDKHQTIRYSEYIYCYKKTHKLMKLIENKNKSKKLYLTKKPITNKDLDKEVNAVGTNKWFLENNLAVSTAIRKLTVSKCKKDEE